MGERVEVNELADRLMAVSKLLHCLKGASSKQPGSRDRAAYVLLFKLLEGPKRATALADMVQSDLSTVSRHASQLVREGLVEKQADADKRASLLAVTDEGRALCADLHARRKAVLARVLSRWSDEDVRTFDQLLGRFNSDLEAMYSEIAEGISDAWVDAAKLHTSEDSR